MSDNRMQPTLVTVRMADGTEHRISGDIQYDVSSRSGYPTEEVTIRIHSGTREFWTANPDGPTPENK
jgi:hypothetical protein